MAIDIKFAKFDNTSWGFRLIGGSEYGFPMTVVKVFEGGLAESFGLREGDVLVALNEQGLVGLSHEAIHDFITKSGNNFIATILRGEYEMEDLESFTARIEKQPLFPTSCLSQESIDNCNSLSSTPTPLLNGTCVNKVPSQQLPSSSPCPIVSETNASSTTSNNTLYKPIAKTYKPFTKDINTTLPPLEKPVIAASPALINEDFQTIRQKELLESVKKIVPDISKYVDKKNIGRSTPTFVIENMNSASKCATPINGTMTESVTEEVVEKIKFDVVRKEFKSVKPPMCKDAVVEVTNGIKDITTNGTCQEVNEPIAVQVRVQDLQQTKDQTQDFNAEVDKSKPDLKKDVNQSNSVTNGLLLKEVDMKTETVTVDKKEVKTEEKVSTEQKVVKDDIIINGGILLDLNEIEKSVRVDDRKIENEKIIEIVKESESSAEENNKEVRKSVKCMVEDYTRATTPSPSLYKMSCRIRNPSVTPVMQDPINVIEEVKIIKEEIIHYSPVPRMEPKPQVIRTEQSNTQSTSNKSNILTKKVQELSTSDMSLEEAKVSAISAASVLSQEAKQRNYKIPCVSANIPAQNQSDVLLKTFFIHLTDVMVALTKMITNNNECCHCGRVMTDCAHRDSEVREKSQTVSNLVKEISEKISNTQTVKESSQVSEKIIDRVIVEKSPEKKVVHKSEAVQTEALKEVFQSTSKLGVDVTVNGKDPLLWLADLDEKKIMKVDESKKLEVISESKEEKVTEKESVSEVKVESVSKEVVQEAKSIVETVTSMAVESAVVSESKQELKLDIVEEIKEETKKESVVIEEVGENEYSVRVTFPKTEPIDVVTVAQVSLGKKEEIEVSDVQIVESATETDKVEIEETNLYMEETSATIMESEQTELVEEITSEPIKKGKKPKKKKMMKVVGKDPLTPNTDEFFFRLDVKLDGLRTKTPDPTKEHEDLSIVRRPDQPTETGDLAHDSQSMSEKKASLKLDLRNKPDEVFVLVCQPSSEDSTPSGEIITKKTTMSSSKEMAGSVKSESVDVSTAKANVENVKTVEASALETNASALSSNNVVAYTVNNTNTGIDSLPPANFVSSSELVEKPNNTVYVGTVVSVEQQTYQASAHDTSFNQTKDESSKLATDSNTTSEQTEAIRGGQGESAKAITKVTSTLKDVKMSTSESYEKKEEISKTVEETSDVCEVQRKSSTEDVKKIKEANITVGYVTVETNSCQQNGMFSNLKTNGTISNLKLNGTLSNLDTNGTISNMKMNGIISNLGNNETISNLKMNGTISNMEMNGYSNGYDVKSMDDSMSVTEECVAIGKTKEANICFASVESSRITNGLNGGSYEVLGKPGLTDEEITEILSGDAEMTREEHVVGLQKVLASHMSRPSEEEIQEMVPLIGFLRDSEVFKAINEESIKSRAELLEQQRKNTKFLQKPNRPIPFCKRLADLQSKEPSYRVDIRPQKRRDSDKSSILTEGVFLIPEVPILIPEPAPELYVAPPYLEDSAFPDLEDTGIPIPEKKPQTPIPDIVQQEEDTTTAEEGEQNEGEIVEENRETTCEDLEEMKEPQVEPWKELAVEETIDESLPVEEQLLKVQKQLEALSKLPAAIQHTLDIVTKQLVNMVPRGDTPAPNACEQQQEEIVQESNGTCENSIAQEISVQEEMIEAHEMDEMTSCASEFSSRAPSRATEDGRRSVQFDDHVAVREIQNGTLDSVDYQRMRQDVVDELTMEHMSRQVKQRPTPQTGGPSVCKAQKQPAFGPLTPVARPLVLPGGRKWRGPKDAFTDAFIAETLSGQATVIQGKTIGVDFMKFKKPPVSLDHLKESGVFKLIHEMEDEPAHGVGNRPKVIAECEYRERCQSATPSQMENGGGC